MLRKLKTNLTQEDITRPALDLGVIKAAETQPMAERPPSLPYPEAVAKAAFQPGGMSAEQEVPKQSDPYDVPDIWSRPIPPTSSLSLDYQPTPEVVAPAVVALTRSEIQPQVIEEGVIYAPHDPGKTIQSSVTIPSPVDGSITIRHD